MALSSALWSYRHISATQAATPTRPMHLGDMANGVESWPRRRTMGPNMSLRRLRGWGKYKYFLKKRVESQEVGGGAKPQCIDPRTGGRGCSCMHFAHRSSGMVGAQTRHGSPVGACSSMGDWDLDWAGPARSLRASDHFGPRLLGTVLTATTVPM